MKQRLWLAASVLAIAAMLSAPARCRAQTRCTWLNAATAAGVLGGAVQMTVAMTPDSEKDADQDAYSAPEQRFGRPDAVCEFTRNVDSKVYSLRIDVKSMTDPAKQFPAFLTLCKGTIVALKGIGNEAVQCVLKSDAGMSSEQVIGRVRERAFVLTIVRAAAPASNGDGLRNDTRNMAEQVAGSLF
jgi:hypothetical protein